MKKYRVTALPKMQDGGSKKKYKSKYDIESEGFFTSDMDEYREVYEKYSDSVDSPTMEGFIDYFTKIGKDAGYLLTPRTDEEGNVSFEAYQLGEIYDKMVYNGIRPQQMSAKMNLGDKKQLENLLKEEIDLVNEIYLVNNQEKIEELLMEGKTPDEVIDDLYKRGMGTKEGLTSKFKKYSEKSQDDLIKRSKELLQELFSLPEDQGLDDLIDNYDNYYDPQVVGKKSLRGYDGESARGSDRLEYTQEYAEAEAEREKRDREIDMYTERASTTATPALDAYNENRLALDVPELKAKAEKNKYTSKSLAERDSDLAPDPNTEPKLEDFTKGFFNPLGVVNIDGVDVSTANLPADYDPIEEYNKAHKEWENTPKMRSTYQNAYMLRDLFRQFGIDGNKYEKLPSTEKARILQDLMGEIRDESKLSEDGKTSLKPKSEFEKAIDKSAEHYEKMHDPSTFYQYSKDENEQPSVLGILFNKATGTKTFSEAPPIEETDAYYFSKQYPKQYDEYLTPKNPNKLKYSGRDLIIQKGAPVFSDFELPTEDLIGFDIPLMPTGIGGLSGAPNWASKLAQGIKGTWSNPITQTLGVNKLANVTGLSKYVPKIMKNASKHISPSNALHAGYLYNSPEYIKWGLTEDIPNVIDHLSEGEFEDAAEDAAWGTFNLASALPWYRGAKSLYNMRGGLNTVNAPFLKDYTIGLRSPSGNTGLQFNPQTGKDIKSIFSVPVGDRGAFGVGKYRPRMGEGMGEYLQLQKQGGITKGKSKIQGDGMFTTRPFKKGEMIGLAHEDDQPATELGKMHNHDEANPTMISRKIGNQRYVFANRDLEPGEELTTNYRMQPELEQPEDFQKGGFIPKGQRGLIIESMNEGREALKSLRGIKQAIPTLYQGFVKPPLMSGPEAARFADLSGLLAEYGFTGVPNNVQMSRTFSADEINKFRDVQRQAARQKLRAVLKNANVTKEDLIGILSNPELNKTLFKGITDRIGDTGRTEGVIRTDYDAATRSREMIENLSMEELLSRVEQAILSTGERNIAKPTYELGHDRTASNVMDMLHERNAFEIDNIGMRFDDTPYTVHAADLRPGEQVYYDFENDRDFRDQVPVRQAVGSLFGHAHGNKHELLDDFVYKLNRGFWRSKPNTVVTGSTDTSDDSYLMQMGRILRTASPRKADMYGVVPHPMFLGYHPANRMSRLSNFLQQSTLGLSRDQQNALRASYLQSMLDKTYELQGIPPEERLPVLMGGPERVDLPMMEDYGSIRPNQVVLP